MASRAAIEEQIRLLNEQLVASTTYDPEFTPKELVRWNPDLIGTVLHCEHTPKPLYIKDLTPNLPDTAVEIFGIITETGMFKYTPDRSAHREIKIAYNEEIYDDFKEMIIYKRRIRDVPNIKHTLRTLNVTAVIEDEHFLGSIINPATGCVGYSTITITLVPEDKSILDHIYISSIITLPYSGNPQIIHKYPLSHLYKKWKQEKDSQKPATEPEDPRTKP